MFCEQVAAKQRKIMNGFSLIASMENDKCEFNSEIEQSHAIVIKMNVRQSYQIGRYQSREQKNPKKLSKLVNSRVK